MFRAVVYYRGDNGAPEQFTAVNVSMLGEAGTAFLVECEDGSKKLIPVDVVRAVDVTPIEED